MYEMKGGKIDFEKQTPEELFGKERPVKEEPINLGGEESTGKGEKGERKRRKLTPQEKAEQAEKKRLAEEKKKARENWGKFENFGQVYDPENLNRVTKDKAPKSAAKAILETMVPAKVWRIGLPEDATHGMVVTGTVNSLEKILREQVVDELLVAMPVGG